MPHEAKQPAFEELAATLPDHHRAEFFRNLHEAGISANDVELARLLRALQLYKAYYETIPAAIQKSVGEIKELKQEIEQLSNHAHDSSNSSARLTGQVIEEAEKVYKHLAKINEQVEKSMLSSSESLTFRITELLSADIDHTVVSPLQSRLADLAKSNHALDDAIDRSNKATAALRQSAALAGRIHLKAYAISSLFVLCSLALGFWFYLHQLYEDRIEQERTTLIEQIDKNRTILLELAKSDRTLKLLQDPKRSKRKFLVMENAYGWQLANEYGVIEFED